MSVTPTGTQRDAMPKSNHERHIEQLLDEALADSFPASDPVSTLIADSDALDPAVGDK